MTRLLLSVLLLLLSLLTVCPIPAKQIWYLAIAVSEFSWVWIIATVLLLIWICYKKAYRIPALACALVALCLYSVPIVFAYLIAGSLDERIGQAFGRMNFMPMGISRATPYSLAQTFTGIGASKVAFRSYQYAPGDSFHSLDIYPSAVPGFRPCIVVVHGGSWKSGTKGELPDVNAYFAKAGYQVATINYRLAPEFKSPAPQEDVHLAFTWLRIHAQELNIDTNAFVLLGRSAGGQIVLTAAYGLHERGLRGVIGFYGPIDMIYGYSEPHNQRVMRHRQVMEDFFGGSPVSKRQAYLDGSPARLANDQSVPTLLVHGMLDQHVHFSESQIMDSILTKCKVPHLLLRLPWATHGCEYSLNSPYGQLAVYTMERFIYNVTR